MICKCRNCGKKYGSLKARGDWKGYCSAKCQHTKAKELGYSKKSDITEYQVLNNANEIGDIPYNKKG